LLPRCRAYAALFLILAILGSTLLVAQEKAVEVKGYTKKDGTVVQPHTRRAPSTATPKAATPQQEPKVAGTVIYVERGPNGRLVRSSAARHAFMKATGYPTGRPGFIIDHVVPLACGGADAPSNMQWQTIAEAKAKDRVERLGC
jgi:hypothetical protein